MANEMNKIPDRLPRFKTYLQERGITQAELRDQTFLSRGTVSKLVNYGIGSKSVILLVSYVLNIQYEEMLNLLKTNANSHLNQFD